jgi:rubrerythrin
LNRLRALSEVRSTKENIEAATAEETFEFRKIYRGYVSIARQEANEQAYWSFDVANKVEQVHVGLFKLLKALTEGTEIPQTDYYVCGDCGNTVEGAAPESCPTCSAPKTEFFRVT